MKIVKNIRTILPCFILTISIFAAMTNFSRGQLGMSPVQTPYKVLPTYLVDIVPGAAMKNATEHYYPSDIAVPEDTTVAWFNDDPGQPHTVTSDAPNSPYSGLLFNSGIMPYGSFMQYTFADIGNYVYHCEIHPWRVGSVYVSLAHETGRNFKLTSGTDYAYYNTSYSWVLNRTQHDRILLSFKPIAITVDRTTPLTYNITLLSINMKPIFSKSFFTIGNDLQLELVQGENNQTTFYGPDFSDPITGTYHIQKKFASGEYILRAELTAIGSNIIKSKTSDDFRGKIIT